LSITENFEIILVNDGSPDEAWNIIRELARADARVKGINFSRNFGQHYAISAGIDFAMGDWVVIMDCDLQDQPEEIVKLYNKAMEGYDYVTGKREDRKDSFLKKISSRIFHGLYSYLSGMKIDHTIGNFGIYKNKVVKACNNSLEVVRAFGLQLNYVGFKHCAINIVHASRFNGKSSYTLSKLLQLSFDIILSSSNKPLKLTVKAGFLISVGAFGLAIFNILANFYGIIGVPGYTTTVFSIWFVGGMLMFTLGIIGLYIGKIFDQAKGKPIYIVSETTDILE
jgi:dolichol-phosphate mannosyltransferase